MKVRPGWLLMASVLALSACGGDDDDDGASATSTTAARVEVSVYFVNDARWEIGEEPYVDAVTREVSADDPQQGALDALFAGPTARESGLSFVASKATGARLLEVTDGVARVELVGDCSSGGSTLTIATEIGPTLKQFDEITSVKIFDPQHETETPDGPDDSIPLCLEP
jgi:spore germination protein GerM